MGDLPLEGGCTCGMIRYRLGRAPITINVCHCRFCQRLSGSAFAINAMIEADGIELFGSGEPEGIDIPTDLSQRQRFWRCPNCAVILFNDHVMMRESIRFVRVGTLDHGERLRPDAHYFVARKHTWVLLPPDVPAYETLPESVDAGPPLSPEARARMAAALRP
jgi:hypothetical protein